MHIYAGLLEGELVLQPLRSLNVPDTEDLSDILKSVLIAVCRVHCRILCCIADTSGYNAVHQCGAEQAILLDIALKVLAVAPVVRMPENILFQLLSVGIDQLAGKENNTRLSGLEALIEQHGNLCREACRRKLVGRAGRIVGDACLCRVRCHILQLIRACNAADLIPVLSIIRIVAGVHGGDDSLPIYLFSVLRAAKVQGIKSLLLIDILRQALGDRLCQRNLSVPVRLFIGHVEPVIHECAKEVSFAELQHLHRRCALIQNVSVVT